MSSGYEIKGTLRFASAKEARAAFETLTASEDAPYHVPEGFPQRMVTLDGAALTVRDSDFVSGDGESYYKTLAVLRTIAETAIAGKLVLQEEERSSTVLATAGRKKPAAGKKKR